MQSIDGNTKGTPNKKTKSPAFPEKKPQWISTNKTKAKVKKSHEEHAMKKKASTRYKDQPRTVHVRQELREPKGEDQALSTDFPPRVEKA